eukprot:6199812-Pleurochrysis_carterae.AAC.2
MQDGVRSVKRELKCASRSYCLDMAAVKIVARVVTLVDLCHFRANQRWQRAGEQSQAKVINKIHQAKKQCAVIVEERALKEN